MIDTLEKRIAEARDGKPIETTISFVEPVDQTKDYDRVIRMMEMDINDQVNLDEHEFAQYVMDRWSWARFFSTSNRGYAVSGTSQAYLAKLDSM